MIIKILAVLTGFILIAFVFYKVGYSGGEWSAAKSTDTYLEDVRKIEQKLVTDNADITFVPKLQSGDYVLEIHFPKRIVSVKLTIAIKDGSYLFTSLDGLSSGTSVQIRNNTIMWSWDIGYGGTEYYVGHIEPNCLMGNVFVDNASGTGIAKWLIKLGNSRDTLPASPKEKKPDKSDGK